MKAVAWTQYGSPADALKVVDTDKPSPKEHEVLIKVHSSTVTAGDARLRGCKVPAGFWFPTRLVFGLFKPRKRIPGMEFSGEVEATGSDVKRFCVGDRVYGTTGIHLGAHAESVCIAEGAALLKKPDKVSHNEAVASLFGGITALHFLKDEARLGTGQRVLINGASGAVGCASVQIARHLGAEVTAVCSTANTGLVKSLGADHTIDYTQESIVNGNVAYDFILDTVGNMPFKESQRLLEKGGKLIAINSGLVTNLSALFNKQLISGIAEESKENLGLLRELVEKSIYTPVIDRVYPLEQIAEAHEYVDSGHKKGNVVISVAE